MEILKKGSKGTEVKALQEALKTLGYSLGIYGVDSKFGSATEKALKKYQ
jgi:peptidoglycan hydrolase-like protein with peptidoglycan-binding domain